MLSWRALQAANFLIRFIQPKDNLPQLQETLTTIHKQDPFTTVVDLTRGKLRKKLQLDDDVPTWDTFSIGRIRQATKPELPTSGHLLSHNPEEIRTALANISTDHVLVLDDTSFSGTTSSIVENLLRQAFPEKQTRFTHGFLILNEGTLGKAPGAKERIAALGSKAVGGMAMHTPHDNGWHFFDIVKQRNIDEHLAATLQAITAATQEEQNNSGGVDEDTLRLLFPDALTQEALHAAQKMGRFVASSHINGDLHVRNPQSLPNIVAQGHLLPPHKWRAGEKETIEHLQTLHKTIEGAADNA